MLADEIDRMTRDRHESPFLDGEEEQIETVVQMQRRLCSNYARTRALMVGCSKAVVLNVDGSHRNEREKRLACSAVSVAPSCAMGPVIDIEAQLESSAGYGTSRLEIGAFPHSSLGFADSQSSSKRRLNCFDKRLNI